jgi:Uncharacterized conserved protein (DUF2303)
MDNAVVLSNAEVIANLARSGQGVLLPAGERGAPFVITAPGHSVVSVERFLDSPVRDRGTTTLDDLESFIAQVVARSDEWAGQIYWRATEMSASFSCVFNAAGWRDLRALYVPRFRPNGNDGPA